MTQPPFSFLYTQRDERTNNNRTNPQQHHHGSSSQLKPPLSSYHWSPTSAKLSAVMRTHQRRRAELLLKKSQQGQEDGKEWVGGNFTRTNRNPIRLHHRRVLTSLQFQSIHLAQHRSHHILFPSLQYVLSWGICVQDYNNWKQSIVSQSPSSQTTSVGSVAWPLEWNTWNAGKKKTGFLFHCISTFLWKCEGYWVTVKRQ